MKPSLATPQAPSKKPLVFQSDGSVLVETAAPGADEARDELRLVAELVKAPEHVHTYRLTPLSLWNAAATGADPAAVLATLERYARFPVPESVRALVREEASRPGRLCLGRVAGGKSLELVASDETLARDLARRDEVRGLVEERRGPALAVARGARGPLKLALARLGWPVVDEAGFDPGAPLELSLREQTRSGVPFALRPYQREAVEAFLGEGGREPGGSGTIVLPCGSGKTLVGIAAIARARTRTLVLATGVAAVSQWRSELLERTTLDPASIAELTSESARRGAPAPGPVTLATYSLVAHRKGASLPWADALAREDWGLVVLDEVHLLPPALFDLLARLQHRRRLGLTATLLREDGREADLFALVGPRRSSVPWRALERAGWIAEAVCAEVRVPLAPAARRAYDLAPAREKPRLAAENPAKLSVLERLLERHAGEPTLVLGTYVDQLEQAGALANAPVLSGTARAGEREALLADFRAGRLRVLVLSRVGNHALDLPEAAVAIQLSGTFGSRQEEAQRLGRILRPKKSGTTARFYALVSPGTVEEEYALRRQLFLTEQGYRYEVADA